jgi:sugar O-acyltransferase (sialic acid O-acetyltransferase NeuD family)
MRNLVIVGAGGHGREITSTAILQLRGSNSLQLRGIVDDRLQPDSQKLLDGLGVRFLGDRSWLRSHDDLYALGIGSPAVRKALDEELIAWGRTPWSIIHPAASLGSANRISSGVVIAQGAVVTTNVDLGRHVHLNVNSSVSHDSTIGSYVTISPGAVICGSCVIEEEVYIGANACVLQGITIGRGAVVGAGACVVSDVAPGETVIGVPARPMHSS